MDVLCTNALKSVLMAVLPGFTRATGVAVAPRYASTGMLLEQIAGGARPDLAILTTEAIDDLIGQGVLAPGSKVALASSAVGLGARQGAPAPAIDTVERLIAVLLGAKTVAHSSTGISGVYAPRLFEKLGIADEMRTKVVIPDPVTVGEAVARGDAELALQQVSELMPVRGVAVLGALPPEVQQVTVFAASVGADAATPDAVRALIAALAAADAQPLYRQRGLEPLGSEAMSQPGA